MIRACIFDLDGTLADTLESIAWVANRVLEELGLPPQETERILRAFFGFDCYLKTKEAEYRIVRGLFRPERHTLPFGTVRTRKDGRRIYAVQGGVIEIEANRERVGA